MATIDYKTFLNVITPIVNARFPVLVRGRHGIGKSTIVYQLADKMGLPVIERRASQMTEGDLLGLPKQSDNDVTEWCPPKWFKTACTEPVVLFLDEVDRATLEVRQGIFELCDSPVIVRINAAARDNGLTYSQLIAGLKKANIDLDRKVLASLAVNDKEAFSLIVEQAKSKLAA